MGAQARMLAALYLRLSDEESKGGESASIANQRMLLTDYCQRQGITIVREFVDDGFSGGNFARPGFQQMLEFLKSGQVNLVLTKDLSRLGRDMREASYYAEQFFPEQGIRFLAPNDNFDTDQDNPMAPFQFAMNEVYLRDGSKKVRSVLQAKREQGQYCACPPYGYRKAERESRLLPDSQTASVVSQIFQWAADGDSSRSIAQQLDAQGVIPPLKYRVLYRDEFGDKGAARAADNWNWTTVKRILRNRVYLGHTLLGKSRKASVKSKRKIPLPVEEWTIRENTHPALVTQALFDLAQKNLAANTRNHNAHPQVRTSIFRRIAYCAKCGHAMCSGGSVYKGERGKYWYLACNNIRSKGESHCDGVRIRYYDLLELVRQDLNQLLALSQEDLVSMAREAVAREGDHGNQSAAKGRLKSAQGRILAIDKIMGKLYADNAAEKLSDQRLDRMVADLEKESAALQQQVSALKAAGPDPATRIRENYAAFYRLAQQHSHIEMLDRETLLRFVERIEIGPKRLPEGSKQAGTASRYQQELRISYRFLGTLGDTSELREIQRAPEGSASEPG